MKELALSIGGTPIPVPSGISNVTSTKAGYLGQALIQKSIITLLIFTVILCLVFVIWGGIQWTMSGGEKEGLEKAKKKITYALIGMVVAFLAFFIVNVVGKIFGANLI